MVRMVNLLAQAFDRWRGRLQAEVDKMDADGLHTLPAGEWMGPLVIDKPLILRGEGPQTVIWSPSGPVLVVASPGVYLSNLRLEVTLDRAAPAVVHLPGCEPDGLRSESMNEARMIDLGVVVSGQPLAVPLQFSAQDAGWTVQIPPHYGTVQMYENRFKHLLAFQVPDGDGYLFDYITLTHPRRGQERYLMTARLNTGPVESVERGCLIGEDRAVYFGDLLEMDSRALELITGDRFTWLDDSPVLLIPGYEQGALWLPSALPPEADVVYNGERLHGWTRRRLTDGGVLQIDTVVFTLHPRGRARLNLPLALDFDAVNMVAGQRMVLPVRNQSGSTWDGRVYTLVPWLRIPSDRLTLPPGRTGELTITLADEVRDMENGQYASSSAVVLVTADEVYFIAAHMDLVLPDHQISASGSATFAAGQPPPYAAELIGRRLHFEVWNSGRQPVSFDATAEVAWIDLDETHTLGQGEQIEIEAELGYTADALPPGRVFQEDAIRLTCRETGERFTLVADFEVRPPRQPQMTVQRVRQPGQFNRALPRPLVAEALIMNTGLKEGQVRLMTPAGVRVQTDPPAPVLQPGAVLRCLITVDPDVLVGAVPGSTLPVDLPVLTGMQRTQTDVIRLRVPVVDAVPHVVLEEEPAFEATYVTGDDPRFHAMLTVRNDAPVAFHGRIAIAVDWLVVDDSTPFTLAPEETETFTVALTQRVADLPPGTYHAMIEVAHIDAPLPQPITGLFRLRVEQPAPDLVLHTPHIWFGSGPSAQLVLGNYGSGAWMGRLDLRAAWLDAPTTEIMIPPGQILRLPLRARVDAVGVYDEPDGLLIEGLDGVRWSLPVRAMVLEPQAELVVDVGEVDLGVLVQGQFQPLQAALTLTNSGSSAWERAHVPLRVPRWLSLNGLPDTIPPGESVTVTLALQPDARWSMPSLHQGVLMLDGLQITVRLEVHAVAVNMQPERIIFTDDRQVGSLIIANRSPAAFLLSPDENLLIGSDVIVDGDLPDRVEGGVPLVLPVRLRPGVESDAITLVLPTGEHLTTVLVRAGIM